MSNTIEVQEVGQQALAVREASAVQPAGLFGAVEPAQVIERASAVATALRDVISRQGLISDIKGKQYPKCEAWTLLGTMLGVFPVLCWSRPVEGGWEARVEARTKDGSTVGAAEAQCLRGERNWKDRDDFALRSMAQTRATAKCLRMPLGFVMTLAGYEPTPAEEMVNDHQQPAARTAQAQPKGKPPEHPTHAAAPQSAPKANVEPKNAVPKQDTVRYPTEKTRQWMMTELRECWGLAVEYFEKVGCLIPGEALGELPLRFVPVTREQMAALKDKLAAFGNGEEATPALPPNPEGEGATSTPPKTAGAVAAAVTASPASAQAAAKPIEVPRDDNIDPNSPSAPWRSFPMPWGKEAGTKMADLDKKYLYGLWANYKVETEFNGKPKRPESIAKDQAFRDMLDEAGKHYEFTKND